MRATTRLFGEIVYQKKDIIYFFNGLPGFEDMSKFVIIDNPDSGGVFKWLQSLEQANLAFVVINPFIPSLSK
jgi:flagellar assembly factor FliW